MPKKEPLDEIVRKLLDSGLPWPPELNADTVYEREHDDHDGTHEGKIQVGFTPDGDAWITTDKHRGPALRFRTPFGGGSSIRVRNALVLLALAIHRENEEDRHKGS
jgi:hypothetical protein